LNYHCDKTEEGTSPSDDYGNRQVLLIWTKRIIMYEKPKDIYAPTTVDEVADLLVSDLMASEVEKLNLMEEKEFLALYREVATIILEEFKIWTGNDQLLHSCFEEIEASEPDVDPALIILRRVKAKLEDYSPGVYFIT
jgi:hypothetical protein